jgi:hypothetical protein
MLNVSFKNSLPTGWRADIIKDGNLPERTEHVFAYKLKDNDSNGFGKRYGYYKSKGTMKVKEAFLTGYGIPHEINYCRTWDGRSPLQKCKFPFKVQVRRQSVKYLGNF